MTLEEIHNELKQIRFVNLMPEWKTPGKRVFVSKVMESLLEKYQKAIEVAPIQHYILFMELYVEGRTQQELSVKWGYGVSYIKKLNKKLCQYLQSVLTD